MTSIPENNTMTIQEMINSMHNPCLINPTESPNGNQIYHLYSNGEITNQKGGWAYLQRSEFTIKCSIPGYTGICDYIFPIQGGVFSYAIVTLTDAIKIRNEMIRKHVKPLV
jgi:mRNA deadenylase 3'-5' endonuclease subunit Ccr4